MTGHQDILRERLLVTALDGAQIVERIQAARITLEPRQATGRHHHPCPVVGHVVAGTIRFRVEGEPEQILRVGDASHEPANARIVYFDNASATEHAAFVAFYLLPPGEARLIVAEPDAADGPSARPSAG